MKNLEQYVGREVKGIKFASGKYDEVSFPNRMEPYIGQEGIIKKYEPSNNTFIIDFESPEPDCWCYPVEEILPQLEGELVGYLINDDEKYVKIISGLVGMSVSWLLRLSNEEVHFDFGSVIYDKVKEYDLLDKCTPVYKQVEIKLPVINGYEGEDMGDYLQYGCAKLLKSWFTSSNNRSITSITLDSGVTINKEQINKIQKYLLSKRK